MSRACDICGEDTVDWCPQPTRDAWLDEDGKAVLGHAHETCVNDVTVQRLATTIEGLEKIHNACIRFTVDRPILEETIVRLRQLLSEFANLPPGRGASAELVLRAVAELGG
jgi:hypothetical protein